MTYDIILVCLHLNPKYYPTRSIPFESVMESSRLLICFLWSVATQAIATADVTSWRNGGNGEYPEATALFDWTGDSDLLWKIETTIKSNACPIIIQGRLYYCEEPAGIVCVDANTGNTLWIDSYAYEDLLSDSERRSIQGAKAKQAEIEAALVPLQRKQYQLTRQLNRKKDDKTLAAQLEAVNNEVKALQNRVPAGLEKLQKPQTKDINGYASYTPCSDGEYIYTCSGLGTVAKYSLDGKRIWAKRMEWTDHEWGGSSSPILAGDKLIVRFADYAALDLETGEELWRTEDPVAFGTPVVFKLEGQRFLYTVRGELIRASDGKKLPSQDWTIQGKNHAFFNTNAVVGNRIYAVHGASEIDGQAYCMEIPNTVRELEKTGLKQIWNTEVERDRYYASPLVHQGLVYVLGRYKVMQALDAITGDVVYSQKIPNMRDQCYAGLLLIGDKIFLGEESGLIVLLEPGSEYREAKRFRLEENRSSPIFDGDMAYLRTLEHLYAWQIR